MDPARRPPDGRSAGQGRATAAWPSAAAHERRSPSPPPSALDLAANLSRRSETLITVAPKLRSKPAAKIVNLLLAEDCVSPAEAARQAPMTDRAARRRVDRLGPHGALRELTRRPAFRLYGL